MRNRLIHLGLTAVLAGLSVPATAGQPAAKPGQARVNYMPIPNRSFLDERKKTFFLGLAVPIDWPKMPAAEQKRLIPLMTKDVRLRNCAVLWQNPNMTAYFRKSGAKMQISVFAAHGEPIFVTTMTIKNCPAPPKKQG